MCPAVNTSFKASSLVALLLLAGPAAKSAAAATTIAAWDVSTLPGGTNNFGPTQLAPTTTDPHVTVGNLTRGIGIGTTGSGAARAWGGNNFVIGTETDAISGSKFATFTVTASTGYTVSFSSVSTFDYRRSST